MRKEPDPRRQIEPIIQRPKDDHEGRHQKDAQTSATETSATRSCNKKAGKHRNSTDHRHFTMMCLAATRLVDKTHDFGEWAQGKEHGARHQKRRN
jgi:hypothetical protein